jgi:uncharacterized protein (DUF2252 family)
MQFAREASLLCTARRRRQAVGAMSNGPEGSRASCRAGGYDSADMPEDQAQRVVEGARHLSPHLGERMRAIQLFGRSIFIRELLPQDLKIELETLTREQAMNIARFLANVVGKAHARQMDADTRSKWAKELSRARTGDLKAPSWLGAASSICLQFTRRHAWSTVGSTR